MDCWGTNLALMHAVRKNIFTSPAKEISWKQKKHLSCKVKIITLSLYQRCDGICINSNPMVVEVALYQMEAMDVCHLSIKTYRSPVYLHKDDRSHLYIRTGNGTRKLDIPEALEYIEVHLLLIHA